ncbi:MAG TPA: hypothetical protein VIF82_10235 [Burkholderiaceae bacterium]|jgi:hypothetical protein
MKYSPNDSVRAFRLLAISYLLLVLLATYYFIAHYPLAITADLIFDDAYYYLGIAHNIAAGKGSTFGDLVKTNGYQPLWVLILAGIIYLFSFPKILAFASIPTLIFFIKSISLFKLSTLKDSQAVPLIFAAAAVVMLYPGIFSDGLETILILLCLPLLSQLKDLPENFSIRLCARYSAIFIFLFLVRLDMLAILGAFSILSFSRIAKGKKGEVKNLAAILLFTAAAVSIYFFINFLLFGTIVPISGLSKALGNKIGENWQVLLNFLNFSRFAMIALFLNFILIKNADDKSIDKTIFSNELRLTIITTLIVAFYYAFFSGWPLWGWYYWSPALVTLYAIAKLIYLSVLKRTQYKRSTQSRIALIVSWIFLAWFFLISIKTEFSAGIFRPMISLHFNKQPKDTYTSMNIKLIDGFFNNAPSGIVAMGDRAGGLGYWLPARFKFFQTEGLVANKEYMLAKEAGTGLDYMKKLGIKYFVVDRERILEGKLKDGTPVQGIVEPVQALSAHSGLTLICLPVNAILYTQHYAEQTRYVYDFTKVTECPDEFKAKVDAFSKNYETLKRYSLPNEYISTAGFFRKYIWNP